MYRCCCEAALLSTLSGQEIAVHNGLLQVRTVGGYQLWPRKFWMWLMGGLTLVESVLLACWITVHAVMLWDVYTYYVKNYKYGTRATHQPLCSCLSTVCTCCCIESMFFDHRQRML